MQKEIQYNEPFYKIISNEELIAIQLYWLKDINLTNEQKKIYDVNNLYKQIFQKDIISDFSFDNISEKHNEFYKKIIYETVIDNKEVEMDFESNIDIKLMAKLIKVDFNKKNC